MLKGLAYRDDPQSQMTAAEVMTTAILAALRFGGDFEQARHMLQTKGYMPYMLSKSRFIVHIMVAEHRQPVGFFLTPGSYSDTSAYGWYDIDLPENAWITGDKAYTDYVVDGVIGEAGLRMRPLRK